MAVSEQRILPPEFIEAAGKTYLDDLSKAVGGFKAADLSQTFGPQFVAGPGALQTQAEGLAGGLGSFQPFLQTAAHKLDKQVNLQGHKLINSLCLHFNKM